MQERIFFQHGGVLVSNARFVTPAATYAMSQVTSVRTAADPERPPWALGAGTVSALAFGCGGLGALGHRWWFAVLSVLAGLALAVLTYGSRFLRRYYVVIATSGGEVRALSGDNWQMIATVANAVSSALVARG